MSGMQPFECTCCGAKLGLNEVGAKWLHKSDN